MLETGLITERLLSQELLLKINGVAGTIADIKDLLNSYVKKTDVISKNSIDPSFLTEINTIIDNFNNNANSIETKIKNIESSLNNISSSGLTETDFNIYKNNINSLVKSITTDVSNIDEKISELSNDVIEYIDNLTSADSNMQNSINGNIKDISLIKSSLSILQNLVNNNTRLKSEKIKKDDLNTDIIYLLDSINNLVNITQNINSVSYKIYEFSLDKDMSYVLDIGKYFTTSLYTKNINVFTKKSESNIYLKSLDDSYELEFDETNSNIIFYNKKEKSDFKIIIIGNSYENVKVSIIENEVE